MTFKQYLWDEYDSIIITFVGLPIVIGLIYLVGWVLYTLPKELSIMVVVAITIFCFALLLPTEYSNYKKENTRK